MKKAIKKIVALSVMGLSLLAFLLVLFILIKGWELRTPLKEGVSALAGMAQHALQRLEEGTARLRAPVDRSLAALDQLEAAVRDRGARLESGIALPDNILPALGERFSQEIEAGAQLALTVGEAVSVLNKSLEAVNRFSRKDMPALKDELAGLADQFRDMKNRLQEFRDSLEELKTGAVRTGVDALLQRIVWFRAPLLKIQKVLEGKENLLAAKRNALINLEGNLLSDIDLGIFGLSLLCPVLLAGQVSLFWFSWRRFRRSGSVGV